MKLLIISTLVLCSFTVSAEKIGEFEISVDILQKHPILIDHRRRLVVRDSEGRIVLEQNLYPDLGYRVPLHIFEEEGEYILVDCNGVWYGLSKKNGELKKYRWQWLKPLPANYIGTFRLRSGDRAISFRTERVDLDTVYLFKDPL